VLALPEPMVISDRNCVIMALLHCPHKM